MSKMFCEVTFLSRCIAGLHREKVRLHRRVASGEQLHANTRRGFPSSFGRPHQPLMFAGGQEKLKYVGAIEPCDDNILESSSWQGVSS
jgi:hypothetical protein